MKALTVQQPYAAAMFWTPAKDIENRSQLWAYRGPLAIHAGQRYSVYGARDPVINRHPDWNAAGPFTFGAVIGVVDMFDAHKATDGCCAENPWAQLAPVHIGLARPRILEQPVDCFGKLGLWILPTEVFRKVRDQLARSTYARIPGQV